LKAEYVNPFLEATNLVFKSMLGVEMLRGRTAVKEGPAPAYNIAIVITIKGKAAGQIIYSMNQHTAFKIAKKLMPGADEASIRKEFRDVLGEIANMITGNALNIFNKTAEDIDLSVPMVVDTKVTKMNFKTALTIGLNLYSPFGIVEVNIAMN